MKLEELARDMRLAALDGYKIVTKTDMDLVSQQMLQLYYHAGRWVGGARDNTARQAFHAYNDRETRRRAKVK
jgi:hypothetical protein